MFVVPNVLQTAGLEIAASLQKNIDLELWVFAEPLQHHCPFYVHRSKFLFFYYFAVKQGKGNPKETEGMTGMFFRLHQWFSKWSISTPRGELDHPRGR